MKSATTHGRCAAPRRLGRFGRVGTVVLALVSTLTALVVVGGSGRADAASTLYVSTSGSDSNTGTTSHPLRTIAEAVDRAASGDTIEVRGGVYRESVQVYRKAVHIRSHPGERAILDGSRPVGGWRSSGGAWYVDGWRTEFVHDRGPMVPAGNPAAGAPDQVFIEGEPSFQVMSLAGLRRGTFFHDRAADRIWIGDDPTGRSVDVSNRSWGIYLNEADGSTLTDVTVRRYGTERRHIAAVRAYGDDLLLDGLVVEKNAAIGISVIGDRVTVIDGRSSDNGYLGLHADRASQLTVDAMSIIANNRAGFDPYHSAGGLKVTTSSNVTVRNSDVSFNHGPGIWSDVSSRTVTIAGNLVEQNFRSGIEVELTSGSTIVGNTALRNGESGIWVLESSDVQVWHNASFDNRWQLKVEEGPRRDVSGVTIRNNVVGMSMANPDAALLDVNDWTEHRSAAQMGVTSDHTVFWRLDASAQDLSRWARWPTPLAYNSSIGQHRTTTGQGGASIELAGADAIPAANSTCHDYTVPDGTPVGAPLTARIAVVLGAESGLSLPPGPPAAAPRMKYDWPSDARRSEAPMGGGSDSAGRRRAVRGGPVPAGSACG